MHYEFKLLYRQDPNSFSIPISCKNGENEIWETNSLSAAEKLAVEHHCTIFNLQRVSEKDCHFRPVTNRAVTGSRSPTRRRENK